MTREEAIGVLEDIRDAICENIPGSHPELDELKEAVQMAVNALVERKKGKWQWLSSTYDRTPCEMRYMCSECHHETILHSNESSYPWERFCPNCGSYNGGENEV